MSDYKTAGDIAKEMFPDVQQTTETIAKMNIYEKLIKIMGEVKYLQKDTKVEYGNTKYKAVSYDAMIGKIRQHFVDNRIVILATVTNHEVQGNRTMMDVSVTLVNVEDPCDSIQVDSYAHADDKSDKGAGKAFTYAVKMALLKLLMLESGDEEEQVTMVSNGNHFVAEALSADQVTVLLDLMTEKGVDKVKVIAGISKKLGREFKNLYEIPASEFNYIERRLKAGQ